MFHFSFSFRSIDFPQCLLFPSSHTISSFFCLIQGCHKPPSVFIIVLHNLAFIVLAIYLAEVILIIILKQQLFCQLIINFSWCIIISSNYWSYIVKLLTFLYIPPFKSVASTILVTAFIKYFVLLLLIVRSANHAFL